MSQAFSRSRAIFALIAAAVGNPAILSFLRDYKSRGHGGLRGDKHAKSSFKQNKRKGL